MTYDLTNNPTPCKTRDGQRADFSHLEPGGSPIYTVEGRGRIYNENGIHTFGNSDLDIIGPWKDEPEYKVGQCYLHDGEDNPLPEGAECRIFCNHDNCSRISKNANSWGWSIVKAFIPTHLPDAKPAEPTAREKAQEHLTALQKLVDQMGDG